MQIHRFGKYGTFKKSVLLFISEGPNMPVITKIEVQKKNKNRFNLYTERHGKEEYLFSVSEDVLVKFQLKKGMELDDLVVEEILFSEEIQKAFNSAIHYLSYRMRSEKETFQYLEEKGYEPPIIQEVIHRLKDRNYINDAQFAEAFVKNAINTADKGPSVIRRELLEKGICESFIDQALSQFSEELQLEKAIKLCEKLKRKKKASSKKLLQQELYAMLMRKGYGGTIAKVAIEELMADTEEDSEWGAITVQGEKAWRKYKNESPEKRELKVKQFLFRKGFDLDVIHRFLSKKNLEE